MPHPARARSLTDLQQAVLAAYQATRDVRETSTRTGASVVYVWKVLRQQGVRLASEERRVYLEIIAGLTMDMSLRSAADLFDVSWQSLQRTRVRLGIVRPRGRPREEMPLDLIEDMRAKGHSWDDIGDVLSRHPDRVRKNYAQKLAGSVG